VGRPAKPLKFEIMRKIDIIKDVVFRAKNPEKTNYQIWPDKFKQVFKYAKVSSIKVHFEGGKNITYIYYFPFNGNVNNSFGGSQGLCSCSKLTQFKSEFKKLKFDKI
jgi:hypothetical protein